jgi:hypothetical protein
MIFNLFPRVVIEIGDAEQYVYDRARLMYTEVAEIEKVTGQSYMDWSRDLGQFRITAIAGLIHVLRKRESVPSDFLSMQFNAADLDVTPIHEDGSKYTQDEMTAELRERKDKAEAELNGGPIRASAGAGAAGSHPISAPSTPASSPSTSTSGPGNGTGSAMPNSSAASSTSTPS